jgi:hypothetical protein
MGIKRTMDKCRADGGSKLVLAAMEATGDSPER